MAITYFITAVTIVLLYIDKVPGTLSLIVSDAFTGTAAKGGFIGSSFVVALRYGVARGIFSNESGQGSAPIAYAAAKTNYPAREGLVASIGPFIDTLVICTLTALVILVTGAWQSGIQGVGMTTEGFNRGLATLGITGVGEHIVAVSLFLFAFSTILGWSYYGIKATEYLFGQKNVVYYLFIYSGVVFLGAIWGIELVWNFVDFAVSFMGIPNLIAILLLAGVVKKYTDTYKKNSILNNNQKQ
jgi:AGCS family alanine or glycine:cation symporter